MAFLFIALKTVKPSQTCVFHSLHRAQKQFVIRLRVQLSIVTAQLLLKESVVLSVSVSDIFLF